MQKHSSDTEERWFTLGLSSDRRLLTVSHTYDDGDPGAQLNLPIYLDSQVQHTLAAIADAKGLDLSALVNDLFKEASQLQSIRRLMSHEHTSPIRGAFNREDS